MNKGCLYSLISIAIAFIIFFYYMSSLLNFPFREPYSIREITDNFESNKIEIENTIKYYNSILPANTSVNIEFNNGSVEIFHLYRNGEVSNFWKSSKIGIPLDSLLNELNWTSNELTTLNKKLLKSNAISISGGPKRIEIGWIRRGIGIYFYQLHADNLSSKEIEEINGVCSSIFYADNIVFTYGSGAIGSMCFPGI